MHSVSIFVYAFCEYFVYTFYCVCIRCVYFCVCIRCVLLCMHSVSVFVYAFCECFLCMHCVYIIRGVQQGSLLIDSSTIDPSVSQQMAVESGKVGATFVDAPVSGG